MITSRARRCWLALALLTTACAEEPRPRALLTIRVDEAAYRPDYALLTWRSPGGKDLTDLRVPRTGDLPRIGSDLATVYVALDPAEPGDRQVVVRGMRGGRQVSVGSARFSWLAGPAQLTVTLGCIPDDDALGGATCRTSVPVPDGGADGIAPDAGAAEESIDAAAGAGPAADVATRPADAPRPVTADAAHAATAPVDSAPPRPDAAVSPDAANLPVDGPDPADALPPPPVDVDLTSGLVLYFKLDDDPSSQTASDSSGNANLGRLSNLEPGRAWVPGHAGRGIELPGGDAPGWISVDSSPSLNVISGALTISAWVRTSAQAGVGRSTIVARAASAGGVLYSLHLLGDRPALWLNSSQGGSGLAVGTTRLARDQWVHLALVYDGMHARLYADARLVAEAAHDLGFAPEISPLTIGGRPGGGIPAIDTFTGRLDDIAMYDRALSPAEIKALADGFQPAVP